jgi:hypothetical protein
VPPGWAPPVEDELVVVSAVDVEAVVGAAALEAVVVELLWVVPDWLDPHAASASPMAAVRANA